MKRPQINIITIPVCTLNRCSLSSSELHTASAHILFIGSNEIFCIQLTSASLSVFYRLKVKCLFVSVMNTGPKEHKRVRADLSVRSSKAAWQVGLSWWLTTRWHKRLFVRLLVENRSTLWGFGRGTSALRVHPLCVHTAVRETASTPSSPCLLHSSWFKKAQSGSHNIWLKKKCNAWQEQH